MHVSPAIAPKIEQGPQSPYHTEVKYRFSLGCRLDCLALSFLTVFDQDSMRPKAPRETPKLAAAEDVERLNRMFGSMGGEPLR